MIGDSLVPIAAEISTRKHVLVPKMQAAVRVFCRTGNIPTALIGDGLQRLYDKIFVQQSVTAVASRTAGECYHASSDGIIRHAGADRSYQVSAQRYTISDLTVIIYPKCQPDSPDQLQRHHNLRDSCLVHNHSM